MAPVARYVIKRWHTEPKEEGAVGVAPRARPEAAAAVGAPTREEAPPAVCSAFPRAALCTAGRTGGGVGEVDGQELDQGAPYLLNRPPPSASAWTGVAWHRGVLRSGCFCPRDAVAGADVAVQARDVMDQLQGEGQCGAREPRRLLAH